MRRGTNLDTGNRFTTSSSERFDDGWESFAEEPDPRTELIDDATRSAFATNNSPDIPFTHSINPYRGCEHGCAYCQDGDTPILMADSSQRALADLRVGDRIYGTIRRGAYRRYVITDVRAHWTTRKEAFRITLADGTSLVASGDHRYLTERGWKYVTGSEQGRDRRPHLTLGNSLMGSGGFASQTAKSPEYERGYLCGVIRGDGTLTTYRYDRRDHKGGSTQRRFRLAMKDAEALDQSMRLLGSAGVETTRFHFQDATSTSSPIEAISAQTSHAFERVTEIIEWPVAPARDWHRGFLAGIFDAEGSFDGTTMRFSNSDGSILNAIEHALAYLGFTCTREKVREGVNVPIHTIRLTGGVAEHLRFLHLVDPAISRKRSIEGLAIKSNARLDVVEIEPLGRMQELFDITTGTEDFIANGVVSHNCYARPGHEYLGYNAGIDFETKIVVKRDAARLAREEMMKKSWKPTAVSISGVTDPYQPIERKLGITRSILETMHEFRNPVAIITKNALVLRDLDLLAAMAKYGGAAVFLSITTLDRDLARRLEPRTSSPALRLHAVRKLTEAGVPVGVAMAPLIPGLTDSEIPALLTAAREAGARWTFSVMLRVPLAVKPIFIDWLEREEPGRAAKVFNTLRDMRDGKLNLSEYGSRMGGTGARADAIGSLFDLTARRLGFNVEDMPLSTESFQRPGRDGQMGLFG